LSREIETSEKRSPVVKRSFYYRDLRNAMGDKYQAIIESPEGDDRRRHFDKKENRIIDIEPLKDVIPVNNGIAPINYGFILNTKCPADNDEIDVLIISDKKLKIGEQLDVYPIALIMRADGDDKIVATDSTTFNKYKEWQDIAESKRKLISDFFSCHYKILSIKDSKKAKEYLENHKSESKNGLL
jgi:inorganic pyrophosphatase